MAGLTANPWKCAIGRVEVYRLGFNLGHGQVRPQIDKTAAVAACPSPKTKKEVRQFLGLAGSSPRGRKLGNGATVGFGGMARRRRQATQ